MKKVVVLFALLIASSVQAEEVHPDWETLVKSGQVVVSAGTTNVAYESDMQYINTLPNYGLVVYGTLVLDGVSTSLKAAVAYSPGSGTVIKRGTSTYVHANYQLNYNGTFTIENGVVEERNWYLMNGKVKNAVNVRAGGTLCFNSASCWNNRFLTHIAGTGYNNLGAIRVDNSNGKGTLSNLTLDDDATVIINKNGMIISGNDTRIAESKDGSNLCNYPAVVDLAGHDLTIGGTSTSIEFSYTIFTNSSETAAKVIFDPLDEGENERLVVFKEGTVIADGVSLEMPANARIDFDGTFTNLPCAIAINGKLTVTGSGSTDKMLSGVISGAGSVTYGTTSSKMGGTLTLDAANTYTGATTLNGGNGFELRANDPSSVPSYATQLTVNSGAFVARPSFDADGNPRWSADDILAYLRDVQITSENKIATLDTTDLVGKEFVLGSTKIAAYFPDLDLYWNATGTGVGRYTLTGPYATENPLNLKVTGGTVRLSGEEQINLGDVLAGGTSTTAGGTLLIDGAKDVVFGDQIVYIGMKTSGESGGIGRMVVTNATIRSTGELGVVGKSRIIVGAHTSGILEIEAGAVVSNQVYVGGGGPSFNEGSGAGAIYQRGGLFVPVIKAATYLSSLVGIANSGFYQLEGGTLRPVDKPKARFGIGGYASYAGMIMTGGRIESCGLHLGTSNGEGQIDFHQLGGEIVFPKDDYWGRLDICGGGTPARIVFFTVAGPTTYFRTCGDPGVHLYAQAQYANKRLVFNVNDGAVLESKNFQLGATLADYETLGVSMPMVLNVNGGILKARVNNVSLFGPSAQKALSKVTVYEKGLTIDTAGVQFVTTENCAITAAGEGGIQSVTLAAPITGVTVPNIRITSSTGYGASLVPLFDSVTHTITNVYVASHGWGYTSSDTIKVYNSHTCVKTLTAEEFTVGDNVTGGFTKQGDGTLKLYNANAWAQWTKVTGGTLQVMAEGAIPDGTALTLSNDATLDLNNLTAPTFSAVNGTGGTIANGALKMAGEISVSAQKYAAGETTVIQGELDLSGVTRVTLSDAEILSSLTETPRVYLIKATSVTYGATKPTVEGVPDGWHLSCTSQGVRLSRSHGLQFILR